MYKLYCVISTIGVLIRCFCLPNPFEPLGESFDITVGSLIISITPDILNWLTEPFLYIITFFIVGIYYKRGRSSPALGSFLYLAFYIIHVGILYLLSKYGFASWALIVFVGLYIIVHIVINVFRYKCF